MATCGYTVENIDHCKWILFLKQAGWGDPRGVLSKFSEAENKKDLVRGPLAGGCKQVWAIPEAK